MFWEIRELFSGIMKAIGMQSKILEKIPDFEEFCDF
jgi:hypothetical protein